MVKVKHIGLRDVSNFTPEKLEELLGIIKKIERLPPIKPFEKGDRRKISGREVTYVTKEYSDEREIYEVSDHSEKFVRLKKDPTAIVRSIGVARYTVKNGRLVKIKKGDWFDDLYSEKP